MLTIKPMSRELSSARSLSPIVSLWFIVFQEGLLGQGLKLGCDAKQLALDVRYRLESTARARAFAACSRYRFARCQHVFIREAGLANQAPAKWLTASIAT